MHLALLLFQNQIDPEQMRKDCDGVSGGDAHHHPGGSWRSSSCPSGSSARRPDFRRGSPCSTWFRSGNLILLYVLAFADWKVAPLAAAADGLSLSARRRRGLRSEN